MMTNGGSDPEWLLCVFVSIFSHVFNIVTESSVWNGHFAYVITEQLFLQLPLRCRINDHSKNFSHYNLLI